MAQSYFTAAEVARRLRLSTKTLANWRCNPRGPGPKFQRFGNRIQYPRDEFEAWSKAHLYSSTADYPQLAEPSADPQHQSDADLEATIDDLVRRLSEAHAERNRRLAKRAPKRKERRATPPPRRRQSRR